MKTPAILGHLIGDLTETQLRTQIIPAKWSIQEIILHLADMEWVFGFRSRTILGDEKPRLTRVDQASWSRVLAPVERSVEDEMDAFGQLRKLNLRCWRGLSNSQLARSGIHEETGVVLSLERIRTIQAGHDLSHVAQIEERLRLLL